MLSIEYDKSWFNLIVILAVQITCQVLKLLQGDPDIAKWARQQISCTSSDFDVLDGEASPKDIQSHLNVAFLDLEDDTLSVSSIEPNVSIEDYLRGRWSCSPSFD